MDYYYVDRDFPRYEMPFHWHIDYEWMRILKGSFRLFLDGQEYLLTEGDIVFVNAGMLHGGKPAECVYECIVYDMNLLRSESLYVDSALKPLREHMKTLQLKQALELIESSYRLPLTLADLSRAAGMSPKYFCRFFKDMTQRTPIDYLNYYRIERACYQICAGEHTLTDIAYNCGFNDFSYFIKTFRRYKNTTPKKYFEKIS